MLGGRSLSGLSGPPSESFCLGVFFTLFELRYEAVDAELEDDDSESDSDLDDPDSFFLELLDLLFSFCLECRRV